MKILLSEAIERYGTSAIAVGNVVRYDIGYGDFIKCTIVGVMSLPRPNDPDNINSGGFGYTFHVILQSHEKEMNNLTYNNMMVYKICPVSDSNIIVAVEDEVYDLPTVPDTVLIPEDFENWDR